MDSLGRINIFLEVSKHQSFAKAAKALGITGPAASKQVMALEDELGVKLLQRTTRLVTLTDEGALYFERARVAMEELKDAACQVQDMKTTPKGSLRINVPLSFGHMHLLPMLAGFARKYPDLVMDVTLEDRKADLLAEGYDAAIRIGRLEDSGLISHHLADCPVLPVASSEYLRTHGMPRSPSDLKDHRMITYMPHGGSGEWKYKGRKGKTGTVRFEGAFKTNTAEMMVQAALDSVGIAFLPEFSVSTHIHAGTLVRILPEYEHAAPLQISILTPPNRYRSTKVKLLMEWIKSACRAMPINLQ